MRFIFIHPLPQLVLELEPVVGAPLQVHVLALEEVPARDRGEGLLVSLHLPVHLLLQKQVLGDVRSALKRHIL